MGRITFVALLGLGMMFTGCGQADAVDRLVKEEMSRQHIPGAAIVVLKAGKMVKVGGYGLADTKLKVPVTPDTPFRLQSVSKQFTATAVMMLVEEGKIRLDDPVGRYLDGTPESWRKITVRHLLGHTSGLRDFINETETLDLRREWTDGQLLASIMQRPLLFEPGGSWNYSDTNYLALGMIIGRVSGQWYGDMLAERIFMPLGMTRTLVPRDRQSSAKGYILANGRVEASTGDTTLGLSVLSYAGGGIQSTVLDLARWDAALYTDRLLKRETLEQMWTPVKLNDGTTHASGFGWEVDAIARHRRISHAGIWTGFATQIDRFVDDQLTVIVLTNQANAAPARIARAVAATFIPALAAPVYHPIPDREPEVTARFKDVLRRGLEGGLRADEFTEPVWSYLAAHLETTKRDFTAIGAIQDLTLVERTETGVERSYRYQARFSRTTLLFHFVLTKEGRISDMKPESVNQ